MPTASLERLFNEQNSREQTTDRHTLVDADYGRSFAGTRVTFRASLDRFSYDGIYPYAGEVGTPALIVQNGVVGTRWTVDGGLTRVFPGRQTVRAGVEFIDNMRQDQTTRYAGSPLLLDSHRSSTQHAVYVQDEIKLPRWFIINAGLRYDGYQEFSRVTPRAALIFLPSSTQSFKYLYGSAFRAPNAYEMNTFNFGDEVETLRPESIDTHEVVWERYINDWLRTSVSTYWYRADNLITLVSDDSTSLGSSFVNQGRCAPRLGSAPRCGCRSEPGADELAAQNATDQETGAHLRIHPVIWPRADSPPCPSARSFVSAEGLYLSPRNTLAGIEGAVGGDHQRHHVLQPWGRPWQPRRRAKTFGRMRRGPCSISTGRTPFRRTAELPDRA